MIEAFARMTPQEKVQMDERNRAAQARLEYHYRQEGQKFDAALTDFWRALGRLDEELSETRRFKAFINDGRRN